MVVDQTESSCRELPGFRAYQETKDRLKFNNLMHGKYEEHGRKYYQLKKKKKGKIISNGYMGIKVSKLTVQLESTVAKLTRLLNFILKYLNF